VWLVIGREGTLPVQRVVSESQPQRPTSVCYAAHLPSKSLMSSEGVFISHDIKETLLYHSRDTYSTNCLCTFLIQFVILIKCVVASNSIELSGCHVIPQPPSRPNASILSPRI